MDNVAHIPSYLSAEHLGPWETYLVQIDRVEPHLAADLRPLAPILTRPKRALIVDVPIRLDNGEMAHFEGYRVQHNLARGPGKGPRTHRREMQRRRPGCGRERGGMSERVEGGRRRSVG